ncbi:copper homeostasis protein CutC [Paracoccus sp. p3-h83]|uniref:copper homeostasis protein CutC n=1 Tax=Paracoccus sp. p3-h83 TaxID=3342805 RepID=UPI0035B9EB95
MPASLPRARGVPLEICVDDAEGLSAALSGGADQIELCAALALGGLTPSAGLVAQAVRLGRAAGVPIFAMIRPRPGDFCYDAADLEVAHGDLAAARAAGVDGVVLGVTQADGRLDGAAIAALRDAAGGLPMVLHRAFDLAPEPFEALEQAIDLGFCRILTSGGAATAVQGADRLAALVAQSRGRIQIMPGGGLEVAGVARLIATGADVLHGSARQTRPEAQAMGNLRIAAARPRTCRDTVAALRAEIDRVIAAQGDIA